MADTEQSTGRQPYALADRPSAHQDENADEAALADGHAEATDDSDDEVADFRNLLPQLWADKAGLTASEDGVQSMSIPKRGEKDFEPTGFRGQERKLEASRKAMEMVISQSRRCGSKALSTASWRPDLNRAIVQVSRGTSMASMGVTTRTPLTVTSPDDLPSTSSDVIGPNNQVGVWKAGIFYPRSVTRVELLPEETLFLIERGNLDCTTPVKLQNSEEEVQVTLSLQHAFSLILGRDGCTRERYQTYAYLKRLGYYVQRQSVADSLRAAAALARKREILETDHNTALPTDKEAGSKGVVADPKKPLKLVTLLDLVLYVPRRLIQVVATVSGALLTWFRSLATNVRQRLTGPGSRNIHSSLTKDRGLLGLGGQQLSDYDSIFSALQIIPSGHDLPPPQDRSEQPFDPRFHPFFYAWRPATRFRKTNPPLPEYRIAAISARDSSLPKLHEFRKMFEAVPLEKDVSATAVAEVDEAEEEERLRAATEKRRNDESYGRGFLAKKRKEEIIAARAAKRSGQSDLTSSAESPWLRIRRILATVLPAEVFAAAEHLLASTSILLLLLARGFIHLPPGSNRTSSNHNRRRQGHLRSSHQYQQSHHRRPNPFPPLKAGRRDVILAVTDHGTTSMLRFGEAEFQKWKLQGSK